jgi:hypothetical protein
VCVKNKQAQNLYRIDVSPPTDCTSLWCVGRVEGGRQVGSCLMKTGSAIMCVLYTQNGPVHACSGERKKLKIPTTGFQCWGSTNDALSQKILNFRCTSWVCLTRSIPIRERHGILPRKLRVDFKARPCWWKFSTKIPATVRMWCGSWRSFLPDPDKTFKSGHPVLLC